MNCKYGIQENYSTLKSKMENKEGRQKQKNFAVLHYRHETSKWRLCTETSLKCSSFVKGWQHHELLSKVKLIDEPLHNYSSIDKIWIYSSTFPAFGCLTMAELKNQLLGSILHHRKCLLQLHGTCVMTAVFKTFSNIKQLWWQKLSNDKTTYKNTWNLKGLMSAGIFFVLFFHLSCFWPVKIFLIMMQSGKYRDTGVDAM